MIEKADVKIDLFLETEDQTNTEQAMIQEQDLESQIKMLQSELRVKDHMLNVQRDKIKKQEEMIREMEVEIKKRDNIIESVKSEYAMLRKSLRLADDTGMLIRELDGRKRELNQRKELFSQSQEEIEQCHNRSQNHTADCMFDCKIECLRKGTHFFSSDLEAAQNVTGRLDKKVHSRLIRQHLQNIKQYPGEAVEQFAERIEYLATYGYNSVPDYFKSTVTIDVFLRGCNDRKAAIATLDKDPKTMEEAIIYMKSVITNQNLDNEIKMEVKTVMLEEPNVPEENCSLPSNTTENLENKLTALEDQQKEHRRLLTEIMNKLSYDKQQRDKSPETKRLKKFIKIKDSNNILVKLLHCNP